MESVEILKMINVGDHVTHKHFGEGIVIEIEPIVVEFHPKPFVKIFNVFNSVQLDVVKSVHE
jgi:hypothetical protein